MIEEVAKSHNHLVKFHILMAYLVNEGEKLENEKNVLPLLKSLPNSCKSLVQTMFIGKKIMNLKDIGTSFMKNDGWLESKSSNGSGQVLPMDGSSHGTNHDYHGGVLDLGHSRDLRIAVSMSTFTMDEKAKFNIDALNQN